MKKLPLLFRPLFARRVLEVGGGHNPYEGVTHAVDKFVDDNSQRAGSLQVIKGVEFREGDLEAIPFSSNEKFDFIYVSHVIEHVEDPVRAISEINRMSVKGYIETPSPLREQIAALFPFDPAKDFHTYFCWSKSFTGNELHFIRKSDTTLGEFCDCPFGGIAAKLFDLRRKNEEIEALLPGVTKSAKLLFRGSIQSVVHESFHQACASGNCAYFKDIQGIVKWTSFPLSMTAIRFKKLGRLLGGSRLQVEKSDSL